MADTDVDWADKAWNPTTGCDWASEGCDGCYAMRMAPRLKAMERKLVLLERLDPAFAKYQTDGDPLTSAAGFGVAEHEFVLDAPLKFARPYRWFVNSMSDLFHKRVRAEFIARVLSVMAATPQHTYQLLTKRPARMRHLLASEEFQALVWKSVGELAIPADARRDALAVGWPLPNLWVGVSVENQRWADIRIPYLSRTPAAVRWLSCEPLIGPLELGDRLREAQAAVDWVVVGGESGHGARPMRVEWARSLERESARAGVPYYFKQAGAVLAAEWGIKGKGNKPAEWPEEFPREFPLAVAA